MPHKCKLGQRALKNQKKTTFSYILSHFITISTLRCKFDRYLNLHLKNKDVDIKRAHYLQRLHSSFAAETVLKYVLILSYFY